MKTRPNFPTVFLCGAILAGFSLFFQSCTPSNEVQPISASPNTVTVKVKSEYQSSSAGSEQPSRHFRIASTGVNQKVLLDTTIGISFTYSFKSQQSGINLTATITSDAPFIGDIEIDVNGTMQAY